MLIGAIIGFCVLLFIVALLFPRTSRRMERGGDAPLGAGQRAAGEAPGRFGRWLQKPFRTSRKASTRVARPAARRASSCLSERLTGAARACRKRGPEGQDRLPACRWDRDACIHGLARRWD
jgi:uncharacterized protein DUF6411